MIPSSIFVEAREALQMTRERFGCGGDEAAAYLEGLIAGGELSPDWPEGKPDPAGSYDWFAGTVWRALTLQDNAITDAGGIATFRSHRRTWPFRLRRQQLKQNLDPATSANADPTPPARRRPVLTQTVARMRDYIDEHGGIDLRQVPTKELEYLFGNRDTCRRALRVIYDAER